MAVPKEATVRWVETRDLIREQGLADSTELRSWKKVGVLGAVELLRKPALGLFCSIRCPGKVILAVYDLARALRDAGIPVIGGFHTPMEKECLDLLLRGEQPVVVCPARSIEHIRLPIPMKTAVTANRLLLLSPFTARHRRATAELADERNRLVAALASQLFVAYAAPGGKTERLCREAIAAAKTVLTVDCAANANLLDLGAQPSSAAEVVRRWCGAGR